MSTPMLDRIAAHGNRRNPRRSGVAWRDDNWITCADGFRLSVIAGWGAYSTPDWLDHPDHPGPFTAVEVMPNGDVPGSWHEHADGVGEGICPAAISVLQDCNCGSVYGRVPVQMVRDLIEAHGGEQP